MRAYIAGPMTGIEHHNFPAFFKAEAFLREKFPYGTFINPARLDSSGIQVNLEYDVDITELDKVDWDRLSLEMQRLVGVGKVTWEDCMRRDIKALVDMTDIVLLLGWEKSRGACLENHIAMALGFRRWFLDLEKMGLTELPLE
jgi:hypothetical protein